MPEVGTIDEIANMSDGYLILELTGDASFLTDEELLTELRE